VSMKREKKKGTMPEVGQQVEVDGLTTPKNY